MLVLGAGHGRVYLEHTFLVQDRSIQEEYENIVLLNALVFEGGFRDATDSMSILCRSK